MALFMAGCALGAVLVVTIGMPFLAPWPFRARYIVAAQSIDPFLGLSPTPRMDMRMVTLDSVRALAGRVELELTEAGSRRETSSPARSRTACPASDIAILDGWSALHTPLLMIIDEDHAVQLFGPDGAVVDLVATEEQVG